MSRIVHLLLSMPPLSWYVGLHTGAPPPGPSDAPGAFLFEEGTIHDFAIELSDEAMHGLGRDASDVHATLTYRGISWDVGLKLKGSSTYQGLGGKPSFKIDMGEWVDHQDLFGVRRLTFNSMVFDPSMLREHVAYRLMGEVGVPAPRHGYARLTVNGEPYGLYGIVETLDERWLRRLFPGDSEGNLYDSTFTNADLTGLSMGSFVLEEGDELTEGDDLRALLHDVDSHSIDDLLDTRFDRRSVLRMWAVEMLSPDWDGYTRNTNNYLLYHATVADRWYFVPWGQDTSFNGGGNFTIAVRGRLAAACLGAGRCRDSLYEEARNVLEAWRAMDLEGYARQTWTAIADACEADPRRPGKCNPDDLFDAVHDREAAMRRELDLP